MLAIEDTIVESGGLLNVAASSGPFAPGQAVLDLRTQSGEHVKSIRNEEGEKLCFPLIRVAPGVYTAEVKVSGEQLLIEMLLVTVPNYEKRLDVFERAVQARIEADRESNPSKRAA